MFIVVTITQQDGRRDAAADSQRADNDMRRVQSQKAVAGLLVHAARHVDLLARLARRIALHRPDPARSNAQYAIARVGDEGSAPRTHHHLGARSELC